jgi:hypothetical protein
VLLVLDAVGVFVFLGVAEHRRQSRRIAAAWAAQKVVAEKPPAAMPAPERPAAERPAGSAPALARPFKRRDLQSADELSRQLLAVPELDLDAEPGTSRRLVADAARPDAPFAHPVFEPLLKRSDLHGLPIAMGNDCRLGKESAHNLNIQSRELRNHLSQCERAGRVEGRLDAGQLRTLLLQGGAIEWRQSDALPALVQMLQGEDRAVRLILVEVVADIKGGAASAALARRALFDLSAEVREAAVRALADRPREEYRPLLLDGLRYPWAPAADHAAEALVALDDRAAIPALAELLAEPDPADPTPRTFHDLDPALVWAAPGPKEPEPLTAVALDERQGGERRTGLLPDPTRRVRPVKAAGREVHAVREVVRVNHLRNCLLCHPPSLAKTDLVRGFVPSPGEPLPSRGEAYNGRSNGTFVRADVTYVRQDFSVPQPVAKPDRWPAYQRYDYLVRTRYPSDEELRRAAPKTYPQREAVRWALRELAGAKGS